MKTAFEVVKSTPNQTGGFVFKLVATREGIAFGQKKTIKRTYYIGGMVSDVKVGEVIVDDLDNYEIVERAYDVVDDTTGEVTTVMLKWLHLK